MRDENFETFKKAVKLNLKGVLSEKLSRETEVVLKDVTKNNGTVLTGISIRVPEKVTTPVVYLESFYGDYMNGESFEKVLNNIAELIMSKQKTKLPLDVQDIYDFEKVKSRILPRLINAEKNADVLKERPYVLLEDLAMSIAVTTQMSKVWGMNPDSLYELAVYNLEKADTGRIVPIMEILKEIMPFGMEDFEYSAPPMYVISNKAMVNGAALLLDKLFMEKVVKQIGNNFYILPSSIHECIAVPEEMGENLEMLKRMVPEVNATEVSNIEILSDNVYQYTTEKGLMRV